VISNLQIRAGRALLGWSQLVLADRAGVSPITIKRLEASEGIFDARVATVAAVTEALEAAGVVFLPDGEGRRHGVQLVVGPGVGPGLGAGDTAALAPPSS
jgi:transcriptional regulator with XRE-family HTH domain